MNELTGRHVNVVLAVEEGRGMDFVKNPVNIVANFNGRVLESDLADPEECPMFNTELIWETEKKDLRKIRSSNAPLRVECYSTDSVQRKDRIGFALLSLRSAHIIPLNTRKSDIPFQWVKLLGVPHEFKNQHPELYLSISIRDYLFNQEPNTTVTEQEEEIEEEELNEETPQKEGNVIPVHYLQDGYIQIGNNKENNKIYILSVIVKLAANLDILLPEVLVFNQNKDKYYISFSIFDITIKSKPFYKNLQETIPLNEKIVIRLISSFEILKAFFNQFHQVVANFHSGEDKLGKSHINMQNLIPQQLNEVDFLAERKNVLSLQQKCFFSFPSPNGIVPEGPDARKPYIDVEIALEHKMTSNKMGDEGDSQKTKLEVQSERFHTKTVTSSLEKSTLKGAGDRNLDDFQEGVHFEDITKQDKKAVSVEDMSPRKEECNVSKSDSVFHQQPQSPKTKPPVTLRSKTAMQEELKEKSCYQQYCLDIVLQTISWKKLIKSKHVFIKFKHPKASTVVTLTKNLDGFVGDEETLEDLRCKLHFISKPDQIRPMIYSWPPKLLITDDKEQKITEEADLYTAMFLAKDKRKCSYSTELRATRTFEPIAKLNISMFLEEMEMNNIPKPTRYDLLPPLIDEIIVVKEIKDLQSWKNIQKQQFLEDLKCLEHKRMIELQNEWSEKKAELEAKLSKSVIRCKTLSEELQLAAESLKKQKELDALRFEMRMKENKSLKSAIKKAVSRYSAEENAELVEKISALEVENTQLKKTVEEQAVEIEKSKKSALTKEQTANLLQELRVLEEKFEDAQRAKSYFKEQWKSAVREIHELRSEDHKQLKTQIQLNKEELSQLNLDELFEETNGNISINTDEDLTKLYSTLNLDSSNNSKP